MTPQSRLSAFLEWVHTMRNAFCQHELVPLFTMESILEDKWERVSGAGQCRKCGNLYTVSIAKDNDELHSQYYLADSNGKV